MNGDKVSIMGVIYKRKKKFSLKRNDTLEVLNLQPKDEDTDVK